MFPSNTLTTFNDFFLLMSFLAWYYLDTFHILSQLLWKYLPSCCLFKMRNIKLDSHRREMSFFFFPPFRLELCTAQILTYDQPENNEKACSDLNLVRELAIVSSFCWILWVFFFFFPLVNANEDKIDMKARVKLSGFMIRVRIDPGFEYNFRILYCVYMYGYEKCKSVANIAHL